MADDEAAELELDWAATWPRRKRRAAKASMGHDGGRRENMAV